MKEFKNISVSDSVVVYDEYSHDYIEHTLTIESIERDESYKTVTNPEGLYFFGTDLGYEKDEDECIALVHEGNFVRFASGECEKTCDK